MDVCQRVLETNRETLSTREEMEETGIPKRERQKHREIGRHLERDRCEKKDIWN